MASTVATRTSSRRGGLAEWASSVLAGRIDRRGVLRRGAMAGTALAVAPATYVLRPTSAYAAICAPGALCNDGYTEFCCTLSGANRCPPGTALGGWWKVDGSSYCSGRPRYYMDCNAACNGCGCGSNGICPGSCSGTGCGCALGDCNNRKAGCTAFRYGQCNQAVRCLGPIVCRVVTCTEPWLLDGSCTTASRTDNRTRYHSRPCAEVDAIGALDDVSVVPGGVRLRGWAIDPETPWPITVNVYDCLRPVATVVAATPRADVANAFPGYGPHHGFDIFLRVCPGERLISVAANDTSGQGVTWLGHKMVAIDPNPVGHFDGADVSVGAVRVYGWVIDPDGAGPSQVDVVVDGQVVRRVTADVNRPDVAAAFPHMGGRFGFDVTVPVAAGPHNVCIVARNVNGGTDVDLGCRPVAVPSDPVGSLDSVTSPGPGTVRVVGWARDADAGRPIDVRVTVDGTVVAVVRADGTRGDSVSGSGFDRTITGVAPGPRTVCVTALNVGGGRDVQLGCVTTGVAAVAAGQVLALEAADGGVHLATTEVVRNDGSPASVRVLVDGWFRASRRTGGGGLDETLRVAPGVHEVAVVATVDGPRTIPVVLATARVDVPGGDGSVPA
jgi:hypothetical protein